MTPPSPLGWLSRIFATRRGRSRKTRSAVASVRRRRVAAMELVRAWAAPAHACRCPGSHQRDQQQLDFLQGLGVSGPGPPSTTPSSPSRPPGWMIASVSSPPSAERTVTLMRPETTTITVSPGSLLVNTTWPRRSSAIGRPPRGPSGPGRHRTEQAGLTQDAGHVSGHRRLPVLPRRRPRPAGPGPACRAHHGTDATWTLEGAGAGSSLASPRLWRSNG